VRCGIFFAAPHARRPRRTGGLPPPRRKNLLLNALRGA